MNDHGTEGPGNEVDDTGASNVWAPTDSRRGVFHAPANTDDNDRNQVKNDTKDVQS